VSAATKQGIAQRGVRSADSAQKSSVILMEALFKVVCRQRHKDDAIPAQFLTV
jgi:hypothetical protein